MASKWRKELRRRENSVRVALDVSSGDEGLEVNLEAAIYAISKAKQLEIVLVGREDEINYYLDKKRFHPPEFSVVDAKDIVAMKDSPVQSVRNRENSIVKGIELLKNGEVDGFVSIGNTGAIAAAAMIILKKLPSIERTPILSVFPTIKGHPIAVLDVGANVDCRPCQLMQFAVLGSTYAELVMERKDPKIALISIGEEKSKGNSAVKEAHKLLEKNADKLGINFIGNIEGRDILFGYADVIVCDGFVGNILLKYTESIYSLVKALFKKGRRYSVLSLLGGLLLYPSLKRTIKDFNYAEYGGAPLLGVNGNVVIGHGSSSVKAIANAILLAQNMALVDLPKALSKSAEKLKELKDESNDFGNRVVPAGKSAY